MPDNEDWEWPGENEPIQRYLPWLEVAELAQEMADAWNVVVEHREADVVKCECEKCEVHRSREPCTYVQGRVPGLTFSSPS